MIHETIGKGSGLEVHHLIEQRFASKLGIKEADIPSIVLTKDEHRKFTNAWKDKIGYNGLIWILQQGMPPKPIS